jgi:hypothetical protein
MYITRYCCRILMKLKFSRQIFGKSSNIRFHENPSSGSRIFPCVQKDRHEAKVAFRNFVNAPNNRQGPSEHTHSSMLKTQ